MVDFLSTYLLTFYLYLTFLSKHCTNVVQYFCQNTDCFDSESSSAISTSSSRSTAEVSALELVVLMARIWSTKTIIGYCCSIVSLELGMVLMDPVSNGNAPPLRMFVS